MNHLVKIVGEESGGFDGTVTDECLRIWHLSFDGGGGPAIFCDGRYYSTEDHEGSGEVMCKEKWTKRGGITCPDCIEKIKQIKLVKL